MKRLNETAESADTAPHAGVRADAPRRRMAWPAAALAIICLSALLWVVLGAAIAWLAN